MKKIELYRLKGLYREDFVVEGYRFGGEENSACIVGALRGNEMQQLYICSQLIKVLKELEAHGAITHGHGILVVPTANSYSMNVGKRFWAVDNIDINRTFPGDLRGDTTKQIAGELFEKVKGYSYGIQFASFYMPGDFIPHVRMMDTGRQNPDLGCEFGLPYVYVRTPRSYDQTTLNYNWQLCGTQAYSLYAGKTREIDEAAADQTLRAIVRFLNSRGVIRSETAPGHPSTIITNADMISVSATSAGLLRRIKFAGAHVRRGEQLAFIINPCDGSVREVLKAPVTGMLFFMQDGPFITDHGEVRIVECGRGFIRQCNAVGDILKPAPLKHKVGSKGSLHAILCGLEGAVLKTQCTKYLIVGLASQRGYLHNGIIRTGAGNRTIHSHEFAGIEGGLSQLSGDLQRLCTRHCRVDIHLLKPQILVCHVLPASILIIAIYLNACSGEESNH